jgi:uncharacterized lipoprotein YddW (UPF0748 family)
MGNRVIVLCALFALAANLVAQTDHPKREFRGVWVATVVNLDWPDTRFESTAEQKADLVSLFDRLKGENINAIVFQVRAECDAYYDSPYEPWSYWLTGASGTAPSPYYDPLAFAVEEAHKRGMELHAWFNPYRAEVSAGSHTLASSHPIHENPEWVLQFGDLKVLNPGIPEVRDYVTTIVADVVKRYDVDGVHFDDYFYPSAINDQNSIDDDEFNADPRGIASKADWRRDNVNLLMKQVRDSVKAYKPYVKFGVSPPGIYKNGVPSGIIGRSNYDVIYCDPIAWLRDGSIDYLNPQMYWEIGGGQDYYALSRFWADSADHYGRHLYAGHGSYRIVSSDWSPSELPMQLDENRRNDKVQGSVFFRAFVGFLDNQKGMLDSLRNRHYKYPALIEPMDWIETDPPNAVANLSFDRDAGAPVASMRWDAPTPASDGDTAFYYAIYQFDDVPALPGDLDDATNLFDYTGEETLSVGPSTANATKRFVATALDRNHNESVPSNILTIEPPAAPELVSPADGATDAADDLALEWRYADGASEYFAQAGAAPGFANELIAYADGYRDTTLSIENLQGETTYYWRVKSKNPAGESDWTTTRSFTTAFPASPELLSPIHASIDLPANSVELVWSDNPIAESYDVQIAATMGFTDATILDTIEGIEDTTTTLTNLDYNKVYFWRVAATNSYGTSRYTTPFGFRTASASDVDERGIPTDFALRQNYPNPFNPVTSIEFALPRASRVTLRVYSILGELVAAPVDRRMTPGVHVVAFDASSLASGVYVYELRADDFRLAKKMTVVK